MIETIKFMGKEYLKLQEIGNASQFAKPFANILCKGKGYDIGYGKSDWKLEGAIGIDLNENSPYTATNLPDEKVDFIYSSHCLEHLDDWVYAIDYWSSKLKKSGVLFLYLPHEDQEYWNPWNNRKHKHILNSKHVKMCMEKFGFTNIFYSEKDLNCSFMIIGEKK